MLRRVVLVRTDASKIRIAFFIRMTASLVPNLPIFVALMMEAIRFFVGYKNHPA
jgi:hypothetical protein